MKFIPLYKANYNTLKRGDLLLCINTRRTFSEKNPKRDYQYFDNNIDFLQLGNIYTLKEITLENNGEVSITLEEGDNSGDGWMIHRFFKIDGMKVEAIESSNRLDTIE